MTSTTQPANRGATTPVQKLAEQPLRGRAVTVIAQAPLDQSPRMVAQAWMLAEAGAEVRFVAYGDPAGFPIHHPRIHIEAMIGAGRDVEEESRWPLLRALKRLVNNTQQLRQTLARATRETDLILAQIPPFLPGVWLASCCNTPLVIDWHNLSAPMAALKLGARHPALGAIQWLETRIGRRAACHFAVTPELCQHLAKRLRQPVHHLPDRPLQLHQPTDESPKPPPNDRLRWRSIVSPTSWSHDEAMEMLLEVAAEIEIPQGFGLQIIATGKGPLRAAFEGRANSLQRENLTIETAWLEESEYRALLQSADAGISLHNSASGLDFPMKIIDMEAAQLPIFALDYGETLRQGIATLPNTRTFTQSHELRRLIETLFQTEKPICSPNQNDWQSLWSATALPALIRLLQ